MIWTKRASPSTSVPEREPGFATLTASRSSGSRANGQGADPEARALLDRGLRAVVTSGRSERFDNSWRSSEAYEVFAWRSGVGRFAVVSPTPRNASR